MSTTKYNLEFFTNSNGIRETDDSDLHFEFIPLKIISGANGLVTINCGTPRVYPIKLLNSTTKLDFTTIIDANYNFRRVTTTIILLYAEGATRTIEYTNAVGANILPSDIFVNNDKVVSIPSGKRLMVVAKHLPNPKYVNATVLIIECKRIGYTV